MGFRHSVAVALAIFRAAATECLNPNTFLTPLPQARGSRGGQQGAAAPTFLVSAGRSASLSGSGSRGSRCM